MKDKKIEAKILADLRSRKIDGLQTATIAKMYGISISSAYRFMLKQYESGFKSDSGASLFRNSGDESSKIKHTHWFFS